MKNLILLAILFYANQFLIAQSIDLIGPAGSEKFGDKITILPNGNYVVIDSGWDDGEVVDVGAVYLYDGSTNILISTLKGSTAGDQIGSIGITVLTNGNYVISSPNWDNGAATDAGAVTWADGTVGIDGVVSISNSLVGSSDMDNVGLGETKALTNGNYVISSTRWNNGIVSDAGAVTWGDGMTGISGIISSSNSLVGSTSSDFIGKITALSNGNYVVSSSRWDDKSIKDVGAVTWGNGATGISGTINSNNSLIGSTAFDQISNTDITEIGNSNYVVSSTSWNNGIITSAGAVTWCDGATGTSGTVNSDNSLIGNTTFDRVGRSVVVLSNGNYLVISGNWSNGTARNAGAVTWGDSKIGVSGVVDDNNSLVGNTKDDFIGDFGGNGITLLNNGNYIVNSILWDNGIVADVGAVTWGNGTIGVSGVISSNNSLIGSKSDDFIRNRVFELKNGNYVVSNPNWDNGVVADVGAVTWGNGMIGVTGIINSNNSLIGSTNGDRIGGFASFTSVTVLSNGNYVVNSPDWDNGAIKDVGAVTWGNGITGTNGIVSNSNSLTGNAAFDNIGNGRVTALSNGNYVVCSSNWDNGIVTDVGAITWVDGSTGINGVVNSSNSLIGSTVSDNVGVGRATALANGNYVVQNFRWNNRSIINAGALTWADGTKNTSGVISSNNSLVGNSDFDFFGGGDIIEFSNGNYLLSNNPNWDNGLAVNAGIVNWIDGSTSLKGTANSSNSLVGSTVFDQIGNNNIDFIGLFNNDSYLVRSTSWDNGDIVDAGALTLVSSTTAVSGLINTCNSVLGNVANASFSLNPVFNEVSGKLLVGKPAENIITIFVPTDITLADNLDSETRNISGNTIVEFITSDCELIANLAPEGTNPVNGNTSATVRITTVQPINYVKRSYEILPIDNIEVATGKITLYFSQAEFDDFNVTSTVNLPEFPSDSLGIANLLIEKYIGVNNEGTDLSESDTGSFSDIDPNDSDILWNERELRWEVSFDVTGFGSFFVKTRALAIPDIITLELNTCDRPYTASFEAVENAIAYQAEITILARNNQVINRRIDEATISGNFNIPNRLLGSSVEIRIAAIFIDEYTGEEVMSEFSESRTFILGCDENGNVVLENRNKLSFESKIYPNPVENLLQIQINLDKDVLANFKVMDMSYRVILEQQYNLFKGQTSLDIDVKNIPAGQYIFEIQTDRNVEQMKFLKL